MTLLMEIVPIVTLDKIYINPDEEDIYFLDCTRMNGTDDIVSRKRETVDSQIMRISRQLHQKEILLADDVVFTGSVLKNIRNRFSRVNVQVVGVIASICTMESYRYFNSHLKYGMKANYIMSSDVIDQICERDFYFGIAGSGIMVNTENGLCKAPYFKPYGNPYERASIPLEYENYFSRGCLKRSIYLWEEIDDLKKSKTKISELPEKIVNTSQKEEVVKTLKKELKKI